jgi:hypothetical protein
VTTKQLFAFLLLQAQDRRCSADAYAPERTSNMSDAAISRMPFATLRIGGLKSYALSEM